MDMLKRFFRPAVPPVVPAAPLAVPAPRSAPNPDDEEVPRYPPFVRGFPISSVDALLASQRELLRRLQDGVGLADREFAELVLPSVRRYAAFVHQLPASEAHHHRGAGGLFRHGLEVAFLASQASAGKVFAMDRSPDERHALEPRWRVAAGLAGLCHDLGKPLCDLRVIDRDGTHTWSPHEESLVDWAHRCGIERYFIRWNDGRGHNRHQLQGPLVVDRIVPASVRAWLGRDPRITAALLAAIAGQEPKAVLTELVSNADAASVARDLRENRIDPNAAALGIPVDRYLLDAMRHLVGSGQWRINVPGARLWMLPGGLHVVWPQGGEEIREILVADRVPGIPRSPDTLADILLERGHIVPRREGGREHLYWRLAPAPLAREGKPIELTMLRLASPDLVFLGEPPATVALCGATAAPASVSGSAEGRGAGSVAARAARLGAVYEPDPPPSGSDPGLPARLEQGETLELFAPPEIVEPLPAGLSEIVSSEASAGPELAQMAYGDGRGQGEPQPMRGNADERGHRSGLDEGEGFTEAGCTDLLDELYASAFERTVGGDTVGERQTPEPDRQDATGGGPGTPPPSCDAPAEARAEARARTPISTRPVSPPGTTDGHRENAADAREWLDCKGPGGRVLLALVQAILRGERDLEAVLYDNGAVLVVRYPAGLDGFGPAADDQVKALWDKGLIVVHSARPLLRVRCDIDGIEGVVLSDSARKRVLALVPQLAQRAPAVAPEAPETAPFLDRSAPRAAKRAAEGSTPARPAETIPVAARDPGTPAVAATGAAGDAKAAARELTTLARSGSIHGKATPEGFLIDGAAFRQFAAEHGVTVSVLLRRLATGCECCFNADGSVLIGENRG